MTPGPRPIQYRRRWSAYSIERLKQLVVQMSYADVARRLRRTEKAVFKAVCDLGGLRRVALEAKLITAGCLRDLLRKAGEASIWQWRQLGLPFRLLGGMSSGGGGGGRGTGATRTAGSYFYSLPDVVAFLKGRPRLIVTLHPDARRLLRLELPAAAPKEPSPSQTAAYRRARYVPAARTPCAVCGRGLLTSLTRYGVCRATPACREERHRRIWMAIKEKQRAATPPRSCERCGGELLRTAMYGVCKRNPDCKAEADRRYERARKGRRLRLLKPAKEAA